MYHELPQTGIIYPPKTSRLIMDRIPPSRVLAFCVLLLLWQPVRAEASDSIEIATRKQLFVDDHVVAQKQGVERVLGKVRKHGIVVSPTLPTDFIPLPDEHWIYYGGSSERHYSIGRDLKIGLANALFR